MLNVTDAELPMTAEVNPPPLSAEVYAAVQAELDAPIRRFIRRTLGVYGDDLTVDDLTQETFIALYGKLSSRQPHLPLSEAKPYAFGIARNVCYQEMRRVEKAGLSLEADHDHAGGDPEYGIGYAVAADPSLQPEEAAYWVLLNVEVQAAIDRLPDAQREVLILYCEQEMSYEEIAHITGANIGTVKSRLHYAKRTLRGMLSAAALEAIESEFEG